MDEKPRHRSFGFRLRTLLVLIAAVAVAAAGWITLCISSENWIKERHDAISELQGRVTFEPEQTGCSRRMATQLKDNELVAERHKSALGSWLRFFGEHGVEEIKYDPPRDPELERRLHSLFPEAIIWLRRPRPDLYAPPVSPDGKS